jgi:Transposase DDE domain/Domain of unknown function (DUF4372)
MMSWQGTHFRQPCQKEPSKSSFELAVFCRAKPLLQIERPRQAYGWGQLVAMLFCQLGRAHSLREICQGLAASEGKLKHLGVPTAPSRSTLAYANQHRPWQLYQTVFLELLARCQELADSGRRKFRFKNKLLSLDATVIDLCATLDDWAKFRRTKGAIKLHLLLDHDGYLPRFAVITNGKTHELKVARKLRWEPGTVVVFDRGYIDYDWFAELTRQGVYWVTRLKDNSIMWWWSGGQCRPGERF